MDSVLAVDLGKTGCRAARFDGTSATATVTGSSPGAPGLATRGGVDTAMETIHAALAQIGRAGSWAPRSACIGAAGAAAAPQAARDLAGRLFDVLDVEEVSVTSDAITAHAGALLGTAGVVLAIGTGAVAVGLDAAGGLTRVDGWGPSLGDEGSGAWIGLAGIRAALRAHDGRGPLTDLVAAAEHAFAVELKQLPAVLGSSENPARSAASFAPDVARLAAHDPVAAGILDEAAQALAATAAVALRSVADAGSAPVRLVLTGGLTNLGAVLERPLVDALHATGIPFERAPSSGDSVQGARLLALRRDLVHEHHVIRLEKGSSR